jgi:lysyl-tRNA synthetase class 2
VRRALIVSFGGVVAVIGFGVALSMLVGRRQHPHFGESARAIAQRLGGNAALPLPGVGHFVTPMLVAAAVGLIGATLWVLLSPRTPYHLHGAAHLVERERARAVVREFGGGSLDYFALRDDKDWFFSGRSVVAHSVRGGVCLVSPDPIGPADEREATWAEFVAYAERHGWSLAVIGASDAWLPIYEAAGLRVIYMGDEAIVDSSGFTLDTPEMKSLRNAYNRVKRSGCTARFVNPLELTPAEKARLEEIAGESRVGDAERGFSMTLSRFYDPHDDDLMMTIVSDAEGIAQAFLLWVPAPAMGGWSLDVMRRDPEADLPNGVMDFAILETIFYVAPTGGSLGLNFALFRDVVLGGTDRPGARLSRLALRAFAGGLQIDALGRFNAKYGPRWQSRYVALDSAEYGAAQGLAIAGAEGIKELPLIGRFLGRRETPAQPAATPAPIP